jgi:hypothetical protein
MMNEAAQALREWDSFFVIVGSSAGALHRASVSSCSR